MYAWSGNIRELESVIHFALLVSGEGTIRPEHLKVTGGWGIIERHKRIAGCAPQLGFDGECSAINESPLVVIAAQLRRLFVQGGEDAHFHALENLVVTEAFGHANHNQVHAAMLLGISRNVMRTLLKRHGLLGDVNAVALTAEPFSA